MRDNLEKLRRALGVGAIAFVTAAAGFTVAAGPAHAIGTDWYVSTTGDNTNACNTAAAPCKTIAEVVDRAGNNDVVHVATGTYAESEIAITYNLTVVGAANGTTTVSKNGNQIFGVFGESGFPTVTFQNLTITGNGTGDGVDIGQAAVNFVDTHVDNNFDYGVDAFNAAIQATRSTFSGNGNHENNYAHGDGIYLAFGALTVDHSTFDGNAGYGIWLSPSDFAVSGLSSKAANNASVSVRLDHSTASNNGYAGVGGYDASIQVWSSTLSGNSGAGIENDSGRGKFGFGEVRNSTITGTKPWPVVILGKAFVADPSAGILTGNNLAPLAARAAKVHEGASAKVLKAHPALAGKPSPKIAQRVASLTAPGDLSAGEVAVSGSIVAKQHGVPDCTVSTKYIVDDGYNVSSDAANSCGFSAGKHDLVKTNPLLGPLADNGGLTQTHLLKKGSPAIDYIPAGKAGCAKSATDQRDLARVQPVGGKCDVGAVELAAKPLAIHPNSLPHGTVGTAYSQQVTATGGQYPSYTFAFASGTLPPGLSFASNGKISGTPTKAGSFTFTVSVNDPVLKTYTIVIDAAAPNDNGDEPISDTGSHTGSTLAVGIGAILAGLLLMVGAGLVGKRRGRHRPV